MLTSAVAYTYAIDDLKNNVDDKGFYTAKQIDLIYDFTPASFTDDEKAWPCLLLNYWFSLAMVELNGFSAEGIMDDTGVSSEAIAHAMDRARGKYHNTLIPIAPPTFKATSAAWLNRGYDVASEAQPGDVVVNKRMVALYKDSGWLSVSCIGGFTYGKCEISTLPSCLVQVRRV